MWVSKLLRGWGWFGRKREKQRDCNNITAAHVQVVWQAFHAFYHSLNKLSWQWKTCQTNLAEFRMFTNISFCTVSRTNMSRWNIFLIEALSMLTSPQIKMVKLLNKKPGISDRLSFCVGIALNFNWFERNGVTTFPWPGCFKSMLAYMIHAQNTKNPSCLWPRCALWYVL